MAEFAYPIFAGAAPDLRRSSQLRFLVMALALVGVVTVAAALAAILAPGIRHLLLREDGIVEMGTVMFLAAVVLGAGASVLLRGPSIPVILAGLLGLAELLDETSFGARLFGFQPLPLHGGGQLDGFHDLLILAYRLLGDVSHGLALLLVALLLLLSGGAVLLALRHMARNMTGATTWLSGHVLLLLHVGFIGLAQIIDIATSSRALSAVEEVLELNAAILLAFYVVQMGWMEAARRRGAR
ncbi:hypothetical protein [Aminobacter sp. HY435]|uniref:hypothetical protein n=1 Tax=Aminobacter sp. HY435 TaxID=2970917 RepID=UPI0022B9863A|nr:hypothetical protein [Aminobacter sp. HY435]